MSLSRQSRLTLSDEPFLIIRTMIAGCSAGVRTTSSTAGWHRLIVASQGVILVRTAQGDWSAPTRHAVWVPDGVKADLETCSQTSLQVLYVRAGGAAWNRGFELPASQPIDVGPLLREVIGRIAELSALDRRVAWQLALARLLLHEIQAGARAPHELVWPRDARAARIASRVQANPADGRRLHELCRGQGASVRTVQRLFPQETGLTFEDWRSRVRFLHAARLLAEGRKVSAVAAACGYRSPSAFVAAFRRGAGVTPGQFCSSRKTPRGSS
jgi:AraC-like DNA-binding protein